MGILAERMNAVAVERLNGVAANVSDAGNTGDAVERAASRLARVNPRAKIADVLVEVDAEELATLCGSVVKAIDDPALVAVAKVIEKGAAEVKGRAVAVRADQLVQLAAFAEV